MIQIQKIPQIIEYKNSEILTETSTQVYIFNPLFSFYEDNYFEVGKQYIFKTDKIHLLTYAGTDTSQTTKIFNKVLTTTIGLVVGSAFTDKLDKASELFSNSNQHQLKLQRIDYDYNKFSFSESSGLLLLTFAGNYGMLSGDVIIMRSTYSDNLQKKYILDKQSTTEFYLFDFETNEAVDYAAYSLKETDWITYLGIDNFYFEIEINGISNKIYPSADGVFEFNISKYLTLQQIDNFNFNEKYIKDADLLKDVNITVSHPEYSAYSIDSYTFDIDTSKYSNGINIQKNIVKKNTIGRILDIGKPTFNKYFPFEFSFASDGYSYILTEKAYNNNTLTNTETNQIDDLENSIVRIIPEFVENSTKIIPSLSLLVPTFSCSDNGTDTVAVKGLDFTVRKTITRTDSIVAASGDYYFVINFGVYGVQIFTGTLGVGEYADIEATVSITALGTLAIEGTGDCTFTDSLTILEAIILTTDQTISGFNGISIEKGGSGTSINIFVNWGDGSAIEQFSSLINKTHSFSTGIYNIAIYGDDLELCTKLYAHSNQLINDIDIHLLTSCTLISLYNNKLVNIYAQNINDKRIDIIYSPYDITKDIDLEIIDFENTNVLATAANQPNQIDIRKRTNLQKLDISGVVASVNCYIEDNYSDFEIVMSDSNTFTGTILMRNNSWNQSTVDYVLQKFVNANTTNRVLYINGNSTPSAAGLANKAILQSRGWTVTTS